MAISTIYRPAQLSKTAKGIFAAIIEQRDERGYVKLNNDESYMPLTVETISPVFKCVLGTGVVISFCHYYKQNGDMMQDPEVTFFVVDNRGEDKTNLDLLGVWAIDFQNAGLGKYSKYIEINESTGQVSFNKRGQSDLTTFCNTWMSNIKCQQGIKPVKAPAKKGLSFKAALTVLDKKAAEMGFENWLDAMNSKDVEKKAEFENFANALDYNF